MVDWICDSCSATTPSPAYAAAPSSTPPCPCPSSGRAGRAWQSDEAGAPPAAAPGRAAACQIRQKTVVGCSKLFVLCSAFGRLRAAGLPCLQLAGPQGNLDT